MWTKFIVICLSVITLCAHSMTAYSKPAENKTFKIASSIYVGWMPWYYANEAKILQKNANESKIKIKFIQGDYIETITQFAAGGVDALTVASIDAVALLVGCGFETDVILIGDYSNGNDAILLHKNQSGELRGKTLGLVEFSVSHYLLDRYIETHSLPFDGISWLNISDAEIASAYAAPGSNLDGVVTWNPIVLQIENTIGAKRIFDSSDIAKEIADYLVVRRSVLDKHPDFGQALLESWFEVMAIMTGQDREKAFKKLGQLSGTTAESYRAQLKTTLLYSDPNSALEAMNESHTEEAMSHVEDFIERHNMLLTPPPKPWVSMPDDSSKAIIHYNTMPLKQYIENQ